VDGEWWIVDRKKVCVPLVTFRLSGALIAGLKTRTTEKNYFVTPSLVLCPELIEGITMKSFHSLPIDRHFFYRSLSTIHHSPLFPLPSLFD
jgi:hypothetical protein